MATADTVSAKVDEAIAAMEGGDWPLAITKLIAARAALMAVPDAEFGGKSPSATKLQYDRIAEIDALINQCRTQEAAAAAAAGPTGSVQYTKIRRTAVSP